MDQFQHKTQTPFRMFKWVPDGIYDYSEYLTRYVIRDGSPVIAITKMWLDAGPLEDLDPQLRQPWGAFPDFPPKPPK